MELASFKNNTNSLNDFFTNVSVITLPKRKEYIINTMKKMNIYITNLFDAILGKDLDKDTLIKQKVITKDTTLRINEIACALSHIQVIKNFYKNSNSEDTLFVFEDDIEYNNDYYKRLTEIMNEVPKDWEYLQFGHCWNNCLTMTKIPNTKYIYNSSNPLCGHSYAITKQGAKKILDNIGTIGNNPMDVIIVNMMNDKKLKLYTIYPRMFSQMKTNSNSDNKDNKNISDIIISTLENGDSCQECINDFNVKDVKYIINTNIYISILVIIGLIILFLLYKYIYKFKK